MTAFIRGPHLDGFFARSLPMINGTFSAICAALNDIVCYGFSAPNASICECAKVTSGRIYNQTLCAQYASTRVEVDHVSDDGTVACWVVTAYDTASATIYGRHSYCHSMIYDILF
jgi:hypothetical protein